MQTVGSDDEHNRTPGVADTGELPDPTGVP
jgi:hypothetical protein